MTTDAFEQPRSRSSFLRNLGTAVAIGLGVTAVPASRAFASSDNPNSSTECYSGNCFDVYEAGC